MRLRPFIRALPIVGAIAFISSLASHPLAAQLGGGQRERERVEEDIDGREAWYWSLRSYPFAERPYAKMSLLQQSLGAHLSRLTAAGAVGPLGGAWRPLGPEALWVFLLESGRISSIVPAVTPGGPMYVGTASGGVWRSDNLGLTWTPLTDNQCGLNTGAMARDPVNPAIVYAATGEGNQGSNGCGVLRTADAGASWTTGVTGLRSTTGAAGPFTSIIVDANSGAGTANSVVLGTTNFTNAGIVRSGNAGASWSTVLNVGPAMSLVAHPTQAGAYFAGNRATGTATARGVYRSIDAGASWGQMPAFPNVDVNNIGRVELAVAKSSPNFLWALVGDRNTGGFLGLFRFDLTAQTWTQLAASGVTTAFGTQQSYDLVLAVDPKDASRIFIAGVTAFRSTDGGVTFQRAASEVHVDWHVVVFDPNDSNIMWAGTDGGVYLSTDAGASWISRSAGLTITQFYPGISSNPQGSRIAGGSQDNGTHVWSGTPYWDVFSGGDGGYTAINFLNPNVQWGETQWSGTVTGNIYRRDATSLVRRSTGLVTSDRAQFIPPLVMDPVDPTKLYFGTYRVYRTRNEGVLWTPVSSDLTGGSGTITTIAIAPTDTNTIYVGTSDGRALVSRDGGLTFNLATGLPGRAVTRVVPHPTDPKRALVTVSGFGTAHIFETTDAFATAVTSINGNLLDAPTNAALYLPAQGVILVGTDVGIFQSADGGTTWALGPSGMPNVTIQDLIFQPATGLLIAGTFGRGMFAYDVGLSTAVLRGDANGDGKVDAFDALMISQTLASAAPSDINVYPRGDANCNGRIDSADLVLILRAAVGLPTPGACVGTMR